MRPASSPPPLLLLLLLASSFPSLTAIFFAIVATLLLENREFNVPFRSTFIHARIYTYKWPHRPVYFLNFAGIANTYLFMSKITIIRKIHKINDNTLAYMHFDINEGNDQIPPIKKISTQEECMMRCFFLLKIYGNGSAIKQRSYKYAGRARCERGCNINSQEEGELDARTLDRILLILPAPSYPFLLCPSPLRLLHPSLDFTSLNILR